ncbi:MAG: Fur family transcriptional regulator [Gemmatimonadales bacterium]
MARLSSEEATALVERFRLELRERRLPLTRQRLAVAESLFRAEDHPSVEELSRRVRARGDRVGTATVYRTLDTLVQSGLAREHDFGEGFKRYEPLSHETEGHEHLRCVRCGRVVEFVNDRLERALRLTADEHGFVYHHHRIEVHGICVRCRGRELGPLAPGGT